MKTKIIMTIMVIGIAALMSACGSGRATGDIPPPERNVAKAINLVAVSASEDVNQAIRDIVTNQNDAQLEAMKSSCRYESAVAYPSSPSGPSAVSETGTSSYTATNTQEASVDEADLIKTDGQYAYSLAGTKLKITKVWPASEFKSVGELTLSGTPQGIILSGNVVVVFSQDYFTSTSTTKTSYCVSLECGGGSSSTTVTMVDVQDPANPTVIKEIDYEGSLISQRRIGDKIYVVVSSALKIQNDLGLITIPYENWPQCDENYKPVNATAWGDKVEDVKRQNRDIIARADFSKTLPGVPANTSVRTYASPSAENTSAIQVATLSIQATDNTSDIVMVLGGATTVYASEKSLYVADSHQYGEDATLIHRFSLEAQTDYAGSTKVDGHLINQFALGEYNDVLRVATTTGQVWGGSFSAAESTVYTLDATSRELTELGKITGIGKGEQIYSVRFVGPRGFVVTFKKIDPLFVLNLRDPRNPSIMGELKVPGFSTYLHPLDENHLIGLGKDAEDMGNFAWFQGLKLAIFDVTDSTTPAESQSLIVGGRYSDSEALYEHHAFTFDASRQLLAIPVTLYAKSNAGGSDVGNFQYSGLQLYRVTVEKGFELLGVVKTNTTKSGYGYGYSLDDIRRSIVIGDAQQSALITMRSNGLTLHKLDAQLTTLSAVSWTDVAAVQQNVMY